MVSGEGKWSYAVGTASGAVSVGRVCGWQRVVSAAASGSGGSEACQADAVGFRGSKGKAHYAQSQARRAYCKKVRPLRQGCGRCDLDRYDRTDQGRLNV